MKRALLTFLPLLFLGANCGNKDTGAGLVPEAGAVAVAVVDAEPAAVDINQCAGCSLVAQQAWTFQGIYRDDKCTDPVAQITTSACQPVPALGQVSITYVDKIGGRKAGEAANITVGEQLAPEAARFRKTPEGCVSANETATDITPLNCAGQRVCRDSAGALACTNCRTFANGCPDLEETRTYATIQDPAIKPVAVVPGNANLEKLRQCCAALATQAKQLGASPEAGMLAGYAAQCQALVAQAGPSGNAPELGPLRGYLQGANIPAICKGL
ncbi:MAG: hypothetical protein KIT84_10335 [Labilithrix sp.]|nr:hypothetical protein [Labilithrix sp.]MCW5811402.1 hypothetical protein [Labilithrix sp.]